MTRIVRFLLMDGQFLHVLMPAATAARIVRAWKTSEWKKEGKEIIGSDEYPPGDLPWAVKVDSIQCIHVCQAEQPQQVGMAGLPTNYGSGRN